MRHPPDQGRRGVFPARRERVPGEAGQLPRARGEAENESERANAEKTPLIVAPFLFLEAVFRTSSMEGSRGALVLSMSNVATIPKVVLTFRGSPSSGTRRGHRERELKACLSFAGFSVSQKTRARRRNVSFSAPGSEARRAPLRARALTRFGPRRSSWATGGPTCARGVSLASSEIVTPPLARGAEPRDCYRPYRPLITCREDGFASLLLSLAANRTGSSHRALRAAACQANVEEIPRTVRGYDSRGPTLVQTESSPPSRDMLHLARETGLIQPRVPRPSL